MECKNKCVVTKISNKTAVFKIKHSLSTIICLYTLCKCTTKELYYTKLNYIINNKGVALLKTHSPTYLNLFIDIIYKRGRQRRNR